MADYGLGAHPSPPDPRDFPLELPPLTAPLPKRYVWAGLGPLLNQGNTPECVAYSHVGLKQWEEKRDGNGIVPFDPDWLYRECKRIDGMPGTDGTTGRAAMKVLKAQGCATKGHPEMAVHYRIAAYYAVPLSVDSIKRAILAYGPVTTGEEWPYSWFSPVHNVVPKPAGGIAGGHETLRYGWDDDAAGGSWYIRNSWGKYAGTTSGNFILPYRYEHIGGGSVELWECWKARDIVGD